MKKIIILVIFSLIITISVFSQDIDTFELDKYQWRKEENGDIIDITSLLPKKEGEWYKILYHIATNDAVFFDVFEFDGTKFYVGEKQYDTIPIYGFDSMSSYEKVTDDKGLEGIYRGKPKIEIDYFEIKKIRNENFKYNIFMHDNNVGNHLIYKKDELYISDSTFGIWENFFFNDLIKTDRSESFYSKRNFRKNLDDRFEIALSDYNSVYKKLTVKTGKEQYNVFPGEFFINEGDFCFLPESFFIYEINNFNSKRELISYPRYSSNIGTVLKKIQEWILDTNRISMWFQIKLPDSRVVWVTGSSLYKSKKNWN